MLQPVLNEEEGFYQIGPSKQCGDQFVLSVTIATAANLAQVMYTTCTGPSLPWNYLNCKICVGWGVKKRGSFQYY